MAIINSVGLCDFCHSHLDRLKGYAMCFFKHKNNYRSIPVKISCPFYRQNICIFMHLKCTSKT